MPPTTEQIPDRNPYDVYATMMILSFLLTLVATLLLNDDLKRNWHFWDENKQSIQKAVTLTQLNEDPTNAPDIISVRKVDLDEWKLCVGADAGEFPVTSFQWPEGYDPLKNPVKADQNNLTLPGVDKLMQGVDLNSTSTPAPAPAAPTAPTAPTTPPAEAPATPPAEAPATPPAS